MGDRGDWTRMLGGDRYGCFRMDLSSQTCDARPSEDDLPKNGSRRRRRGMSIGIPIHQTSVKTVHPLALVRWPRLGGHPCPHDIAAWYIFLMRIYANIQSNRSPPTAPSHAISPCAMPSFEQPFRRQQVLGTLLDENQPMFGAAQCATLHPQHRPHPNCLHLPRFDARPALFWLPVHGTAHLQM